MTDLCRLAEKYGTDKVPGYTPFYDTLFGLIRGRIRSVLEIGIGTPGAMQHVPGYTPGASLRMWAEYFPFAHIVGIDIDPATAVTGDRITTKVCSQTSPTDLEKLAHEHGPFDIVIDDGSHKVDDQILTAKILKKFVVPGGYYIIEDALHYDSVSENLPFPHSVVLCRPNQSLTGRLILIRG